MQGPEPTIICVVGMHRTGTSLVTRLLNVLGVALIEDENEVGVNEREIVKLPGVNVLVAVNEVGTPG